MDQQNLVDLWIDLDEQMTKLKREIDRVEAELGQPPAGTEIKGSVKSIRVQDRAVLKPDKLEQRLTPALWRSVTKRVPVADLLKAAIKRGKIDQQTVNDCSDRSNTWFKAIT